MGRPIETCAITQQETKGIELRWRFMRVRRAAIPVVLLFTFFIALGLAQDAAAKDLRMFYQQNCAECHGPDGSAVSAEGKKLKGQDFSDRNWQRSTTDQKMVETILNGKFFGLAMPSFEDALSAEEAQQMVTEIIRKAEKGNMIAPDAKGADGK